MRHILAMMVCALVSYAAFAQTQNLATVDSLAKAYRTRYHECRKLELIAKNAADEARRVADLHYRTYQRLVTMRLTIEAKAEYEVLNGYRKEANRLYAESGRAHSLAIKYNNLAMEYSNRARLMRNHNENVNSVWYGFYERTQIVR